jgi:hypothetical protein
MLMIYALSLSLSLSLSSDSGQLYTWGNGSDWRLGHGSESIEKFPRKVSTLSDFVVFDIQLGINHCVAFVGRHWNKNFLLKSFSTSILNGGLMFFLKIFYTL